MSGEGIKKIRERLELLIKQKVESRISTLSPAEKKMYESPCHQGQTMLIKSQKVAPNTVSNIWKKLGSEGILIKKGNGYQMVA